MKLIETKGTVKFYEDEKGVQYQQIEDMEPIKVVDGSIRYKHIKTVKGFAIQYNLNGVYGFAIISRGTGAVLETGFWDIKDAEEAAVEMGSYN